LVRPVLVNTPAYLWIVWIVEGLAYFFLIVGLLADELSEVSLTLQISGITESQQATCGWQEIRGPSTITYTSCGSTDCILQFEAGQCWVAFGIFASLSGALFFFGAFRDFKAKEFDKEKPRDHVENWNCCPMLGFSRLGLILCLFFEFLMLVIYGGREKCSSESFWIPSAETKYITKFDYSNGPSVGLVATSFVFQMLVLAFTYYVLRISSDKLQSNANSSVQNNDTQQNVNGNSSTKSKKEIPNAQVPVPPPKTNGPPPPPVTA